MYIRVINILCFPSISVYIDVYIYIYHKCNSAYNYKMYKVSSHALSINYLVTHTHLHPHTHSHTTYTRCRHIICNKSDAHNKWKQIYNLIKAFFVHESNRNLGQLILLLTH